LQEEENNFEDQCEAKQRDALLIRLILSKEFVVAWGMELGNII